MTESRRQGPLAIGDKFLGKYEVRSLLGKGGYAWVYECVDPFLGRVVALKVLKVSHDGPTDVAKRARQEAQVLLRIEHPRLVKLFDAGVHDGLIYLVMEKLEGRTLRDALREHGRLSPAEALTVALQVAQGVVAAHEQGVIHRDIKPENIFIQANNEVKVLDFGIAKVLGQGADTTQRDALQGTVLYMSPEHLQGFGVTPRSDIFALGTVTFEMLFRHPLYLGEGPPGIKEAAWMQMSMAPPLLNEVDESIPHYVARVVNRMVLKLAEQRYGSMVEAEAAFASALNRHRSEDAPRGNFLLRPLHRPYVPEAKPELLETLRAAAILTGQVTVKAPHVPAGDTAPVSHPPFSVPEPSAPQDAPKSSERPVIVAARRSEPPTVASAPLPVAASPKSNPPPAAPAPALSARPAHAQAPAAVAQPLVSQSTAPPISTGLAARPLLAPPPPFFKDRAVRLAAAMAAALGVVAGTSFALFSPSGGEPTAASAAPATLEPSAPVAAALPVASAPVVAAATTPSTAEAEPAPVATAPVATPATPEAAPAPVVHAPTPVVPFVSSGLSPAASARPAAAIPASGPVAQAPAKKAPSTAAPSALDAELEQRLKWLDESKAKPAPKPAASQRGRTTPF